MAKVAVADVPGVDARLAAAFEVLAESPDGVARMRELVLSLAVRGMLVEQRPCDEPASSLLRQIAQEKARLVDLGKLKRSALRGDTSQGTGPYAIPSNWAWSTLAVVFAKITDGTHHSPPNGATGDFPYVSARHIKSEGVRRDDLTWVSKQVHDEIWSRCDPEDGDILYIKDGATTGVVTVCDFGQPFSMLSSVGLLKTHRFIEPWYACYALRSPFFLSQIREQMSGVGIPRVTIGKLEGAVLPLPPLAEQRRIVARVDELMAWIDQFEAARNQREAARIAARDACLATLCAATNPTEVAAAWSTLAARFDSLFTASADVEPLRLAIIHLAVRGALVGRSSQGESGDACPDHAIGWPFAGAGGVLPLGWCWARLGEVADARLGKMLDKAKNRGASRPYLRNTNVHWFRFELGSIKQIPLGDGEFEDLRLTSGDVLICEGGHGIGRSAVWMGQIDGVVFQKALHRVRPTDRLDSWFLTFCLRVLEATGVLASYYTGAGIPHFTGKALDRLLIALPPCDEQRRIVERATELLMVCDQLELALVSTDASAQAVSEALVSCEASA